MSTQHHHTLTNSNSSAKSKNSSSKTTTAACSTNSNNGNKKEAQTNTNMPPHKSQKISEPDNLTVNESDVLNDLVNAQNQNWIGK